MNPKLLEEKINEFLEFYKEIDTKFVKKMTKKFEIETIKELKETINLSSEPCTLPDQIRLNKRIAVLILTLGSLATERVKQANVAFRWLKWRRKSEWSPAKKMLEARIDKVLVGDIENEIAKKTFGEELVEVNLQSLADWLTNFHSDAISYRSALTRQIDINLKDYGRIQQTAD